MDRLILRLLLDFFLAMRGLDLLLVVALCALLLLLPPPPPWEWTPLLRLVVLVLVELLLSLLVPLRMDPLSASATGSESRPPFDAEDDAGCTCTCTCSECDCT